MSLLDDIKAKADANGDGKLSVDDLTELKDKLPSDKLDELRQLADQNDDGKINVEDLKNFNIGDVLGNAKDSLGSIFGKK